MAEKIKVEFRPGGQRYTYETDEVVSVGDEVAVPTHTVFGEDLVGTATVVEIGSDYDGPTKPIYGVKRA